MDKGRRKYLQNGASYYYFQNWKKERHEAEGEVGDHIKIYTIFKSLGSVLNQKAALKWC